MITSDKIDIGEELPPFSIKIDPPMYKKYNRLVHEINPLHFNEKYAQQLGYKTIVVAGVFTSSFFLRSILNWIGDPTFITNYHIRFLEPVYLEDTITQHAKIFKKYEKKGNQYLEIEVWLENQAKQKVISGFVTLVIK